MKDLRLAAYYNELDPKAAAGLRALIADGLIPHGEVDTRSITDVRPDDLKGFTQCHFFAGIGGWSRALDLALWPHDRPVWTGSCPCQPFSSAGKQKGGADHRDLWPVWFRLISECRPAIIFGEQVASAIPHGWLDRVYSDMEAEGYACGSAVLPACAVNAPHRRDGLWFVAQSEAFKLSWREDGNEDSKKPAPDCGRENEGVRITGIGDVDGSAMADTDDNGRNKGRQCQSEAGSKWFDGDGFRACERSCQDYPPPRSLDHSVNEGLEGQPGHDNGTERRQEQARSTPAAGFWDDHEWIICADGKARRIPATQSGIRLLAHGIPERVGLLRAGGNAIVPQEGARFINAAREAVES